MPAPERLPGSLTLEPTEKERFAEHLSALCHQLGWAWAGVALVRLESQGLRAAWLAQTSAHVGLEPPPVNALVDQTSRQVLLSERSLPASSGVQIRGWLVPLATLLPDVRPRPTATLVSDRPLSGGPVPEALLRFGELMHRHERAYVADLLLTAIESGPDPLELTDQTARVFYVNPAWHRYFDYGPSAVVGHELAGLVRDDDKPAHDKAYVEFTSAQLKKRLYWLGTMGSRTSDGQRRFNEVMVSPFDDSSRGHHGNLAIRRDLAHRQGRDAALATVHREFRAVLAAIPDAVIVLRDKSIYFANSAFGVLVGQVQDSVIGRDFATFVHAEDWDMLASTWEAGNTRNVRLLHSSGTVRVAEVSAAGDVSFEGSPSHIFLARDVTEQVLAREEMARSERLAALGALAAGVAHEINNPLSYVTLNLESLREHVHPSAKDVVEEALDGAHRIGAIVAELRGFWNGAGHELGAVDVSTVVTSAVNLAQNEIRHRAELVRELEPGLVAYARQGQLVQVLVNLLVNAAQAIPDQDGRHHLVRIRSRSVSLSELEISVSDTGPGMSEKMRASLLDPFAAVRGSGVGPGFGLALSKRIVEELRGAIEVIESGETGTTIAVRLPRVAQEDAPVESRRSHFDLLQAPFRVLVVDDEPLIARAIRRALGTFVVHVASDGEDALSVIAKGEEFDVILCDLMMPRVSGADLFQRVEREHPSLAKRFVFMTGGAFADWSQRFLDTVDRPIIEKPFQPAQLRKCIESVARKSRRTD